MNVPELYMDPTYSKAMHFNLSTSQVSISTSHYVPQAIILSVDNLAHCSIACCHRISIRIMLYIGWGRTAWYMVLICKVLNAKDFTANNPSSFSVLRMNTSRT